MTTANCPSCGAPVEFQIGSSAVVVCNYCRTVVARTDRGVADYGKVAALIDTGSPLTIGLTGRYRGKQFRLTGRTQMRHEAGGVWDEWYAAFDDGRWGWLAEAQGRYFVTFQVASQPPAYESLELGGTVDAIDDLTVTELGTATLVSGEGEIPWRPTPGQTYSYADLSGLEGRFATIDYSETPPVVFKGAETTLRELGIKAEPARKKRVGVEKLSCTSCGGPLDLRLGDQAERVICPNCGAAHDITEGRLEPFRMKQRKAVEPAIPLGKSGTIDGTAYVIAGFMQRSVVFAGTSYYWTEYLLFNAEKGFRWLVHSDDHWSFVTPLNPGEVLDSGTASSPAKNVHWNQKSFSLFQNANATVTYVVGEFYWKVAVGESVATADYIKPPDGLSKEMTREGAREISWSHARYLTVGEVEEAFGVEDLPKPRIVGPLQPYPSARLGGPWVVMLILLLMVTLATVVMLPNRQVAVQQLDPVPAEGSTDPSRTYFIEGLELSGKYNVAIDAHSVLDNNWIYVAGDLVDVSTGMIESFDIPLEYYHGNDGGESWSEGSREKTRYLAAPARKGTYALRLDLQWDAGKPPPPLHVTVREGVFRWPHFLLAFFAITFFPALGLFRRLRFEMARWKDSEYSPYVSSSDDEDE